MLIRGFGPDMPAFASQIRADQILSVLTKPGFNDGRQDPLTASLSHASRSLILRSGRRPALFGYSSSAISWRAAFAEDAGFWRVTRLSSLTTKDAQSSPF